MKKLINTLLTLVIFVGCGGHTTNESLLEIGGLGEKTFDVNDKEIYAIALETNNESIISSFDKIVMNDSIIAILDSEKMKIFIFDHTGKSLSVISKHGRSAKEYMSIGDIDIFEDKVYILDYGKRKILVANYDGKITKVIKYNNYYGMRFCVDNSGFTLFMHSEDEELNNSQIVTLDMTGKITNSYLQREADQVFPISPSGFFAKNSHANYFIPIFSDKLYSTNGDEPQVVYDFNLGEMIQDNSVDRTNRKANKYGYFFSLYITDDMTFKCSNHEYGQPLMVICNAKSGKIRLSNDIVLKGAYRDFFITMVTSLSEYPNVGAVNYPVDESSNPALLFLPTSAIIY